VVDSVPDWLTHWWPSLILEPRGHD